MRIVLNKPALTFDFTTFFLPKVRSKKSPARPELARAAVWTTAPQLVYQTSSNKQ
jgi:hypothetical protein